MSQFFTDFRDETLATVPAGFTFPWGASDMVMSVVSGNPLAGSDKSLNITISTTNFERLALKWDAGECAGKTTVRVRATVLFTFEGATQARWIFGPLLNGGGTTVATRTGYAQWESKPTIRIARYSSGAETIIADNSTAFFDEGEVDVYLETIRDGAVIETRAWLASGSRPSTATATATDATPLDAGGFFGLSLLSSLSAAKLEIHELAIGINSSPAPTEPVASAGWNKSIFGKSVAKVMGKPVADIKKITSIP